ncbi:unnamed protein product, partial [marine sediment metagenome]
EDIYFRLLIEVVRSGIETGANSIDLGQTAEIPKLRLGGESIPLYMFATHSNPLYRSILHSTIGMLQYRSNAKLECLNFDFFYHLPKNFTVIS